MKPVKFPEQNIVFAENQPQYETLPAFKDNNTEQTVVTCWKLTLKERISLLIKGHFWVSQMTFRTPYHPIYMSVDKKDIFIDPL